MGKNFIVIYSALDKGGVPKEMRSWVNSLSKKHKVSILTLKSNIYKQNYLELSENVNVVSCTLFSFYKKLSILSKVDSYIVAIGYFDLLTLIATIRCKKGNLKFILIPLGQITSMVLNRRIFNSNPDIEKISIITAQRHVFFNKIKGFISPRLKQLYHFLFNYYLLNASNYIGCFSNYEKSEILLNSKSKNIKELDFIWGVEELNQNFNSTNFYNMKFNIKDNKLNFVYWGRLDYFFKGIDVLIKSIAKLKETSNYLEFRIFLMGPDYNNSLSYIKNDINKYKLQKELIICTPDQYQSKEKIPLKEADVSILLSKWDGFPRSLRESVNFCVPVIVSKETNFSDFVVNHNVGVVVDDIADINSISNSLMLMCDEKLRNEFKTNAMKYRNELLWDNVVCNFLNKID